MKRFAPGRRPAAPVRLRARRGWLAGLALLLLAGLAHAQPALWVARRADATVYLFGTVHLLPHDTSWRDPSLDRALAASQALYVEIVDDDPLIMSALVLRYGIDTAHPLSTRLTPAEWDRLQHAARLAGIDDGRRLNLMKPWLAALTLTVAPLTKAGLDPAAGVDRQLREVMSRAGKPVRALETAEQQIRFLADLPMSLQLGLLRSTLRETDRVGEELGKLIDAWKTGDVAAIARLENDTLAREEPALYRRLLVERNAAWAQRIQSLLAQPGTYFIAVGAAHLAGPDSLQARLAALGVTVTRAP